MSTIIIPIQKCMSTQAAQFTKKQNKNTQTKPQITYNIFPNTSVRVKILLKSVVVYLRWELKL